MNFVPLAVKSDYSLLSSLIKIDALINYAKKHKYHTLGLLDNNLFASVEFYKKCINNKIKPIIGLETKYNDQPIYFYAESYEGLQNLFLLHDIIFTREINLNDLEFYHDGIILVLPFNSYNNFLELNNVFTNTYLSYSNEQEKVNALIISKNIVYLNPIIAFNTSDSAYINYLKMIDLNENINTYKQVNYQNYTFDSITNLKEDDKLTSVDFSHLINIEIPLNSKHLPKYEGEIDNFTYLKNLSIKGLKKRLNNNLTPEYKERLLYELEIIKELSFVDYFLIVYDYVLYAKKNNILVGPGRGSAAGSLVSYTLGITEIDPIEYGLLFERFLNKERVSMPDIDVDFEDTKRDEIKNYIINKYGEEYVSSIITFSTLGSKQALRDTLKILAIDDYKYPGFLPLIKANISLKDNYNKNKNIQDILKNNKELAQAYKIASKIEGIKKLISTHAAGIVIAPEPLNTIIPMYKTNNMNLSGITMDYLEDMGLLKMDLLALNNLTIIKNCLNLLPNIKLEDIPLTDEKTFKLFQAGETNFIFQFESTGMKDFLKKLKPSSFSDLYAAVALFRPGPMDNIDLFISRKRGRTKVIDYAPELTNILDETYGIIVYQEQIMQILNVMAGYSYAQSDIVRKAMSKKDALNLEAEKEQFTSGCIKNNYSPELANEVFDLILKFASYGFNKSHSVSYALISYQLAYLKANYPQEFITTLLNMSLGSISKVKDIINEAKMLSVKIVDFDLFKSKREFYLINNEIYLPFSLIKGINESDQIKLIDIAASGINDIYTFVVKALAINLSIDKVTILINCGVLDYFGLNRQTLIHNLEKLFNYAELVSDLDDVSVARPIIENVPEMPLNELLQNEINLVGFYLSNHPTNAFHLNNMIKVHDVSKYFDKLVEIVVLIDKVKAIKTKKNEDMAFITGSDDTGSLEFILFPDKFKLNKEIDVGKIVIIFGKVTRKNDKYGIIINRIKNAGE